MDSRWLEAAQTGNMEYLSSLIGNNVLLLDVAALEGGEPPLHVAAMAGHINFVREILKLRPGFTEELNPDGFSPLHLAAGKGHLEIVMELLKLGAHLCLVKGREGRIPLHYAAMRGKALVLRELLYACPNSIEEVTARGETALHLAVKNSQFEAFRVMVEQLKQYNKENILNWKDWHGNTILHIAVAAKQIEVINFILRGRTINNEMVEVNALNQRGLTPLDILLVVPTEAGDLEIREVLAQAGAASARPVIDRPDDDASEQLGPDGEPAGGQCVRRGWLLELFSMRYDKDKWVKYFKFKKERDSPSDARTALLVVAALITSMTYQAVLQMPGGWYQDDSSSAANSNTTTAASSNMNRAGQPILGTVNPIAYGFFLAFNSFGFFTSIYMIQVLTAGFPMRFHLQIVLSSLIGTYATLGSLAPSLFFVGFFIAVTAIIPSAILRLLSWINK